jgi:16S rRNA (cytosine967-C5)-methyltransferase
MTPAARFAAAIEVLAELERHHRPAAEALKDWGVAHRFAGSSDRASIATLVYDALRRRSSAQWLIGEESARAALVGMMVLQRGLDVEAIATLCSGEKYAAAPLSESERAAIATRRISDAPPFVQADVPEWLWPSVSSAFAADAVEEGSALAGRAPLDLRANLLKADRNKVLKELAPLGASATAFSPHGLRIEPGADGRGPSVQAEPGFVKGWFEIQDEGSQLAALLSGARPGEQVLDLCAGGGGKTLALAAMMGNRGQIFATDLDKRRLAPIHDRLKRAGVRNAQVLPPGGATRAGLADHMDLVMIDAPCTGSGTWRRNPDAKWRVRPTSLAMRIKEQASVLAEGAKSVKPGGRLVYVTCSILPEENDAAVETFLAGDDRFALAPPSRDAAAAIADLPTAFSSRLTGWQLSPRRTGTDGFFIATMTRHR